MCDQTAEDDQYGLGVGVKLRGATTAAIGPSSPVRVTRGDDQGLETVEYAVLMVVEMPTNEAGWTVTLEFTALFSTDPNEDEGEAYLHPSSIN